LDIKPDMNLSAIWGHNRNAESTTSRNNKLLDLFAECIGNCSITISISSALAQNPNLNFEDVMNNRDIVTDISYLPENPNIPLDAYWDSEMPVVSDVIDDRIRHWQGALETVLRNPNVTNQMIFGNLEITTFHYFYIVNPNLTWDEIWAIISKFDISRIRHEIARAEIAAHPSVTWEHVKAHPELPWRPYMLSKNPNITYEIVTQNMNYSWSWFSFAQNPNLTFEIVKKLNNNHFYRELYVGIPMNPNITLRHLLLLEIEGKLGQNVLDKYFCLHNPNMSFTLVKKIINSNINKINKIRDKKKREHELLWYVTPALFSVASNNFCRHPHFQSPMYRRRVAKERLNQMYLELISRACHPRRSVFSWNEGAADEMPEAYAEECQRWREWTPPRHDCGCECGDCQSQVDRQRRFAAIYLKRREARELRRQIRMKHEARIAERKRNENSWSNFTKNIFQQVYEYGVENYNYYWHNYERL
jgi:hypothetical protein